MNDLAVNIFYNWLFVSLFASVVVTDIQTGNISCYVKKGEGVSAMKRYVATTGFDLSQGSHQEVSLSASPSNDNMIDIDYEQW